MYLRKVTRKKSKEINLIKNITDISKLSIKIEI